MCAGVLYLWSQDFNVKGLPQLLSILFLRQGLFLHLELADSTRLPGKEVYTHPRAPNELPCLYVKLLTHWSIFPSPFLPVIQTHLSCGDLNVTLELTLPHPILGTNVA